VDGGMKVFIKKKYPAIVKIYRIFMRIKTDIIMHARKKWALRDIFQEAYEGMKHLESASGNGSTIDSTHTIRQELPKVIEKLGITTLLDAPCGDFNWMKIALKDMGIKRYWGCDIVKDIIDNNNAIHRKDDRTFHLLDITKNELPKAQAILCRDCLVHLSNDLILDALNNFANSGARYLISTTFPSIYKNKNIVTGDWRGINLCRSPFNLKEPFILIDENYYEGGEKIEKFLGVWELATMRQV
jgi:hypothetical protein